MQQTNGSVNSKGFPPDIEHFSPRRLEMSPRCWQQFSSKNIACEQALLFGQVKRVSRERASERRSREGPPGVVSSFLRKHSLRASSPIWASNASLARTRERRPSRLRRSLARSRETRFTCPNRRACSLLKTHHSAQFRVQMSHHGEQKKINSS